MFLYVYIVIIFLYFLNEKKFSHLVVLGDARFVFFLGTFLLLRILYVNFEVSLNFIFFFIFLASANAQFLYYTNFIKNDKYFIELARAVEFILMFLINFFITRSVFNILSLFCNTNFLNPYLQIWIKLVLNYIVAFLIYFVGYKGQQ